MRGTASTQDEVAFTASPAAARMQRRLALVVVVVPALGTAAAVAQAWWGGVPAAPLAVAGVMLALTVTGIEVGFHRLFSHHAFQTTVPVRAALAVLGSMAAQGPVVFWAAIHRRHHACSDRPGDPHSPHLHGERPWGRLQGLWHAHMGWLFKAEVTDWARTVPDLLRDRPVFAVNLRYPIWVLLGLALPAAASFALTGTALGALQGFLWGGLVRIFTVNQFTWSVNSLCHSFGRRPFASRDRSTNNAWLALISIGGSWHNNHHRFPAAAKNNVRWWQLDLAGALIGLLERLGLAWDVNRAGPVDGGGQEREAA